MQWRDLNQAMPHRRAMALHWRWHELKNTPSTSCAAAPQERQHLLHGFFYKYQVPINHPYWTECLGYDSALTAAVWLEAAASSPPFPPAAAAGIPPQAPSPKPQASAAAEDAPAGGSCPAASASGSTFERDSAAAAPSDSEPDIGIQGVKG